VDSISHYRSASEANEIGRLMEATATDVEVVSPISGRMVFKGQKDVEFLLRAVYGSLRGLQWKQEIGDGEHRVLYGEARLLGVRMTDAMVFDLGPDRRIRRISPHLRPWLALTLFAMVLGPKVGIKPGIVWRALRNGAR
jgi:hypothetical protein